MKRFLFLAFVASLANAQTNVPAAAGKIRIACVGASITAGFGTTNHALQSYPTQMQTLLGDRYDVHNYGVSGATMLKQGNRPYWNSKSYQQVFALNPHIVVIDLGGNDSKATNWIHKAEFAADTLAMIQSFRALPSHPRIVLCLPMPSFNPPSTGINDDIIKELIPIMRQAALETGAEVVDLHAAFQDKGNWFTDGIHPNAEGAALMAKIIADAISTRVTARATRGDLVIESVNGPVTANEISAFKSFMSSQTPPTTPWSVGRHNSWAFGSGGRNLEAFGMMYEVSHDIEILDEMIRWTDECVSQRNDLMPAARGGQRVMWTGKIDKVWCPEAPTAKNAKYAGCEVEDTIAHIAYCAKQILQTPALWKTKVPDGDPHSYGVTYLDRAKTYLAKCDEANDDYFLKWFIQADTHLIRDPENQPAWAAIHNNLNAINRQMMFDGGFQRLAECHEILGDAPARVKEYDAIVKVSVTECVVGIKNFAPGVVAGHKVYNWHYFPWSNNTNLSESVGHAAYDVLGIWRASLRPAYGVALSDVMPLANTVAYVIAKNPNNFSATVDGKGSSGNYLLGEWIVLADWNPAVYELVANAAIASGRYANNANLTAHILWMKNRRDKGLEPKINPVR